MLPFRFYTTLLILSLSHLLKFHIPLFVVSRSITGLGKGEGYISPSSSVFLQRKNIGEVARSDGGVNLIEEVENTGSGVKSRPPFVYRK